MTIKFVKMEVFGGLDWNCSSGVFGVKAQLSENKKKMGREKEVMSTDSRDNYFEDLWAGITAKK